MSKTPYELRFDLLQLARNHLIEQFHTTLDGTKFAAGDGTVHGSDVLLTLKAYPTMEDIYNLAHEMKNFVEDKS